MTKREPTDRVGAVRVAREALFVFAFADEEKKLLR